MCFTEGLEKLVSFLDMLEAIRTPKPLYQTKLVFSMQAGPLDTVKKLLPVDTFAEFNRELTASPGQEDIKFLTLLD